MTTKHFKCLEFDDLNQQLKIKIGTNETIKYNEIDKVSILNEEAKFRGKTKPFSHQVLGGTTFYTLLGEPSLYVGLKIVLKDQSICAAYVSDCKTRVNTDIYREDRQEAEKIKKAIIRRMDHA